MQITPTEFVVELITSAVEMIVTIGADVALRDPLSFVSVVVGGLFVAAASAVFGYLALGALAYEFGIGDPASESRYERAQQQQGR